MKIKTKELVLILKSFKAIGENRAARLSIDKDIFAFQWCNGEYRMKFSSSSDIKASYTFESTKRLLNNLKQLIDPETEITEKNIGMISMETDPISLNPIEFKKDSCVKIPLPVFLKGLQTTVKSMSKDAYWLKGICLYNGYLVSTDGRRLSLARFSTENKGDLFFTIPFSIISLFMKYAKGDEVSLYTDKEYMFASCDNLSCIAEMETHQFPDYKKAFPKEPFSESFTFDRKTAVKEFSKAIKLVDKFDKRSYIENGCIKVATEDGLNWYSQEIFSDKDLMLAVNTEMTLDIVKQYSTDELVFKYNKNKLTNPYIIQENDDYLTLLMPINLN